MLTFDLAFYSIHLRNFAPPQLPCAGVLFRQTVVAGSDEVGDSLAKDWQQNVGGAYAASGCNKAASNWSRAQSISSRVITSGGLTRMVWS